jgi:hypothetical protein
MLGSLYPPSTLLLLDLFSDTSFLLFVRLPAEPVPAFGTSIVSMGI